MTRLTRIALVASAFVMSLVTMTGWARTHDKSSDSAVIAPSRDARVAMGGGVGAGIWPGVAVGKAPDTAGSTDRAGAEHATESSAPDKKDQTGTSAPPRQPDTSRATNGSGRSEAPSKGTGSGN